MIAMMSFMDSFPLGLADVHASLTGYAGRRHCPQKAEFKLCANCETARERCGFQPPVRIVLKMQQYIIFVILHNKAAFGHLMLSNIEPSAGRECNSEAPAGKARGVGTGRGIAIAARGRRHPLPIHLRPGSPR
jgi:hypothetical protein